MNNHSTGQGRHAGTRVSRFDGPTVALLVIAALVLTLGGLGLRALFSGDDTTATPTTEVEDAGEDTSQVEAGSSCDSTVQVTVAAAPEIAGAVESAAENVDESACATWRISRVAPADVAAAIESGDAPDVWIPDAEDWTSRIMEHRAGEGRFTLASLTPPEEAPSAELTAAGWTSLGSVARTPVVLAVPETEQSTIPADMTWRSALISAEKLRLAQPSTSSASRLAFLVGRGAEEATTDDYLLLGQRIIFLSRFAATQESELLGAGEEDVTPFPVSEQRLAQQSGDPAVRLLPVMLGGGTPELTYPMYARADLSAAAQEAARLLYDAAGTEEVTTALGEAGFRTEASGGPTINDVAPAAYEAAPLPDAQRMLDATHLWETLRLDMRMLAVIDVSGSMLWGAGDTTRLDLLQRAVHNALGVLPDGSQIGAWVFATNLGEDGEAWLPRVPIRTLDTNVDGTLQRDILRAEVDGLDELITGDTALYDTALAAFREVQKGYDPGYINSVVLITDGENDNPGGGLELDELITQLEATADPERPVRIVTIGIGPDTDPTALQTISDSAFGTSYVATEPEDIEMVFFRALLARAA